jgi:hypothetical protein
MFDPTPHQADPMNRLSPPAVTAFYVVAVLSFAITTRSLGQTAPAPQPATPPSTETTEEIVKMSPFVVDTSQDQGRYQATSTLAGTRVRTDLKDVASSISVVTAQFLRDTGATNNQTLLVYTPNTEVGGIYGNYGAVGNTYTNSAGEPDIVHPNTNTRVRGLDSADNTRDYFQTNIPWDSFNVDRVDLQRGPNSILFGIGSPAGIINTSVNMANFKDAFKVENRYGSFGSVRDSLDFNKVILDQELAIRVAALDDREEYRQRPAFNHDRRLFGAVRFDPKLFNMASAHTTIRANFEHGEVTANRPHELPPTDLLTPFWDSFNKTTYDTYYVWHSGILPATNGQTVPIAGQSRNYWLQQGMPGTAGSGFPADFAYNYNSGAPLSVAGRGPGGSGNTTYYAIGPTGAQDQQIDGLPFAPPFGITGYSFYAYLNNVYNPNDPTTKGAALGFFKDRSLTDPSIFDFYNNLLTGPNNRQWQGWDAFNLALEQTFLDGRLGLQFMYDHQNYHDGSVDFLGNMISVDMAANTFQAPWPYSTSVTSYNGTGTKGTNPNAGRAYVAGFGSTGSGNSSKNSRENVRTTVTGELRATDFLAKSWLTDLLGRHVFTGLYSREIYDNESRSWSPFALDNNWPNATGYGPLEGGSNSLGTGNRIIDIISYISGPLFGTSSPSGLHLSPVTASYSPTGSASISYFDSHWAKPTNPLAAGYVDPSAAWTNPTSFGTLGNNSSPAASTQSENPANYVGWTTGTFNILNADQGDINALYSQGNKVQTITESKALTWQGYLWDDTLAATVGWRRDIQKQRANAASVDPKTGVAAMSYDLLPLDQVTGVAKGNSKSWGLVLHEPKFLRNKLPWGTNVSLTYSVGNNTRVQNRYGFDGSPLPNSSGETKDYGVVINTLDDRLSLKLTWYKTTVKNANMSSNPATSIFGGNAYWLYKGEEWALAGALTNLAGIAGQANSVKGYWDWAGQSYTPPRYTGPADDPSNPAWQADPLTAAEKAASLSFLAQLRPQSFWDAYGYPVNVAAAKAGDWNNGIKNWNPNQWIWGVSDGTGGRINGSVPTGTIDDQSKGVEIELTGQVMKNWNLSVNASKQKAEQISLGAALTKFMADEYAMYQSPAGDLKMWWATDITIRQNFTQYIWGTYQFLQGSNGRMVPEMAPWRCNVVTNYAFDHGFLKGANVGLGYRWQQGVILGYRLLPDYSNLDVDNPIWGKSTYAIDLWAGYEHKLSAKLNWRIQLNVRNVASKAHLETVSVEPDGSPALRRIVEGQTWFLTNTLSF